MRGRPRKEWTAERLRDMLLNRPDRAISVHKLKALVNYRLYPERWIALQVAIVAAKGIDGVPGTMFSTEHVNGVMSVVLKDRGY